MTVDDTPADAPGPCPGRSADFVGRDRELTTLVADLDAAASGRGRVVLVPGEPGIGKSRLAHELALLADQRGAQPVWGRCWEEGGAPLYWPWMQVLRTCLAQSSSEDLARDLRGGGPYVAELLPELREVLPHLPESEPAPTAEDARFRLLDSVTTLLLGAAARRPLVLLLDDFHAADAPSAVMLEFLARRIQDAAVFLYVAYREPEARRRPGVAEALGQVAREGKSLPLTGLSAEDVAAFLASATSTPATPDLVTVMHDRTGGNPLYLIEMVRLLAAQGDFTSDAVERGWGSSVPQGVQQTLRRRLGLLSPPALAILEVASVLGQEFELAPLQHIWSTSAEQLLHALAEATDAGLTTGADDVFRYRFALPLIREVLYRGIGSERRCALHLRAGQALERHARGWVTPRLEELAHHFFLAAPCGGAQAAVDYNARAAERATALHEYQAAATAYERALTALDFVSPSDERLRCDLLLALGGVQNRAGEVDGARQTFLRAVESARSQDDGRLLARAAVGYGRETSTTGTVDGTLVTLLEEALECLGGEDPSLYVDVATRLAIELYYAEGAEAEDRRTVLARDAVEVARRLGDPTLLGYAIEASTLALAGPHNVAERVVAGTEIIRLSDEANRREGRQSGHVWRFTALLELGDTADAERELNAYAALARELGQPAHVWFTTMARATLALLAGRFEEADSASAEAAEIGRRSRRAEAEEYFVLQRFTLLREQGRVDALTTVEPELRRLVERTAALPAFRAALILLLIDLGRLHEARAEFEALARRDFLNLPPNLAYLAALAMLAEAAWRLEDAERARQLYALIEPYAHHQVVLDWSIACYGPARRYLGLCAVATGRYEVAIEHFREALDAAVRTGACPSVAHIQHELADALERSGAPDEARAHHRLALASAEELGMLLLVSGISGATHGTPPVAPSWASRPHAADDRQAVYRLDGEFWTITYDGVTARLKDSKGMRLLAQLLRNPGREVHVLDLAAMEAPVPPPRPPLAEREGLAVSDGTLGPALDARARAAYKARVTELSEDIEDAEAMHDPERASRLRTELDYLVAELTHAGGWGSRESLAGSAVERARQSARRGLKNALVRIHQAHPALSEHLEVTVRTGYFCSYTPDPRARVVWEA